MAENALVSCLCVTRNRVPLLRRAVACFRKQLYEPRELIIASQANDLATRGYVESLRDPAIFYLPIEPGTTLGASRNSTIAHCKGHYIAQWDDDDYYSPARLSMQINAIRISGLPACVLSRVLMHDGQTGLAYLSGWRIWEGSLVAEKSAMPAYPPLPKAEDSRLLDQILAERKLTFIERPDLYIYTYHGSNTWERSHWDDLLLGALPLADENLRDIQTALTLGSKSEAR